MKCESGRMLKVGNGGHDGLEENRKVVPRRVRGARAACEKGGRVIGER